MLFESSKISVAPLQLTIVWLKFLSQKSLIHEWEASNCGAKIMFDAYTVKISVSNEDFLKHFQRPGTETLFSHQIF